MYTLVLILHIIVSIFLILVVLLQTGKGAEIGASFSAGASQTLFGSRGAATFLNKLTTVVAIIFMLTSLSLAIVSKKEATTSVIETTRTEETKEAPQPVAPVQVPPQSEGQSTQPAQAPK